jgi:hypothetical protein
LAVPPIHAWAVARSIRLVTAEWRRAHSLIAEEESMNKTDTNASVANDVLQSDHHVHMSEEEIAKAKAHHDKKHGGENPQTAPANQGKKIPVKPK